MKRHALVLCLLVAGGGPPSVAVAESLADGVVLEGPALLEAPDGGPGLPVAREGPRVYVRAFAGLPDGGKGTLWSSWGDGRLASNGRYYLSIGNHLDLAAGRGESRVYEFDPAARTLRLVVNVRDIIADAKFAGGKIHGRIEEAADGSLYFATYWGKVPKEADWEAGFRGSALLRFDPATGKTMSLGVPVPGQGLPASLLDRERGILYFYAVYSGDIVAYDVAKREATYRGGGDIQAGSRAFMLDSAGNVYFSTGDGRLARYGRGTGKVVVTEARLPGGDANGGSTLRAATRAASGGLIYGMTKTGATFAFDPKRETVTDLGPNAGEKGDYTAVMVLSPDERYIYYAPGAHGSGARLGVPIIQYEIAPKRRKVLAFLGPVLRERFRYNMGGTYNMQIASDGGTLLCTFNGAPVDPGEKRPKAFGLPSIVAIDIPKSERE
ncbi:MAG: hypothetical protein AMS14_09240 [Planctomycetes bacterium DG_20]|nr:MAG: hypothetical protein AMS14_09240 [Planctomycetes bacterium DG_20]